MLIYLKVIAGRGDRIYHPEGSGGGATLGPLALGEPAGFGGVGW